MMADSVSVLGCEIKKTINWIQWTVNQGGATHSSTVRARIILHTLVRAVRTRIILHTLVRAVQARIILHTLVEQSRPGAFFTP